MYDQRQAGVLDLESCHVVHVVVLMVYVVVMVIVVVLVLIPIHDVCVMVVMVVKPPPLHPPFELSNRRTNNVLDVHIDNVHEDRWWDTLGYTKVYGKNLILKKFSQQ